MDDAGKVLNPVLAEGQRHGGIAQGVAQALLEEVRYDAEGNPLTSTLADYAAITATELPSFELLAMETPTTVNPLGVKGIGEAGTIGATPAVHNAVVDAVAHLGVRHIDMPATPLRVWTAINEAKGSCVKVTVMVNGAPVAADVEDRTLLVHFLRETAGLTATNIGCDTTSCGACTVLLDGESVKSCTMLAAQADGARGDHRGRAGRPGRRAAPRAARVPRRARAAVRILHAGDGAWPRCRCCARTRIRPSRRSGPGWKATCAGAPATTTSSGRCWPPPRRSRVRGRGAGLMIPAPFTYRRADSVAEAIELVTEYGDEAKFLAGGHSLLPLMKLRLAMPEVLIDLGRLRELSYIRDEGGHIAIGALTRHHDLEHSAVLARSVPLLAHAAGQVGDPQVRHRGTIGGSLAHSDPASDLPATVLALDATLVARGPSGTGRSRRPISSRACSRPCWNPMSCSPRSGSRCPRRARPAGPSRSSPSGPSTGPSSGSRCRAARWPW